MDIAVTAIAGAAILIVIVVAIIAFVRWRRNRYRFSVRALLLSFTFIACTLSAILHFVLPIIRHRWAVQQIYATGGGLMFRNDYESQPGCYSDPRKANPWQDVAILHARNDNEARTVAHQLRFLPETELITIGRAVSDKGLAEICDHAPNPSFETLELFESPVTANGLSHLTKLDQLHILFFNTCPIDDSSLACLKSIKTLEDLSLIEEGKNANRNRFTELGFQELGKLQNLKALWLARLTISDVSASHLTELTNLEKLQISYCTISDQSLSELRTKLPDCEIKVKSLPEQ